MMILVALSYKIVLNDLGSSLSSIEAQKCQKRQSYILPAIDGHKFFVQKHTSSISQKLPEICPLENVHK